MPRRARSYLPGLPYHVVQRSNNREACFEPKNYQFYLELWQQISRLYGARVHAYCLMTNHIHILATPDKVDSISNTMKVVGSRYSQYINLKYKRTGTLRKDATVQAWCRPRNTSLPVLATSNLTRYEPAWSTAQRSTAGPATE